MVETIHDILDERSMNEASEDNGYYSQEWRRNSLK